MRPLTCAFASGLISLLGASALAWASVTLTAAQQTACEVKYLKLTSGAIDCSSIDISADTNLVGDAEIVLTGDALSLAASMARDSELHSAVTLSGVPDYLTLVGQDIVRGTVDVSDDTNLSGNTENVLTGDALSIASTLTRDTEWDTEAEVQTAWGGVNILLGTELDTSLELLNLIGDATGTGALMFATNPIVTTGITLPDGAVTLKDETAGNYVASATTGEGLLLTGTEGGSLGIQDCAANEIMKRNAGDTAWACAADATGEGGGTFGQATLAFGTGTYLDSVLVTVTDATVTASSRILATATIGTERDQDELEMETFVCTVENIIALTSFDIRCLNPTGGAEGNYLVNFTRS